MPINRRSILEKIYDALYAEADEILSKSNPCHHSVKGGEHSCLGKVSGEMSEDGPACCCSGCPHWDNGCKATRPLACRSWLCISSLARHPIIFRRLAKIAKRAMSFHLWVCRGDRETSLRNALARFSEMNDGEFLRRINDEKAMQDAQIPHP